jgi:CRISPR/Cas system-associated endoribonuclease Cas2
VGSFLEEQRSKERKDLLDSENLENTCLEFLQRSIYMCSIKKKKLSRERGKQGNRDLIECKRI